MLQVLCADGTHCPDGYRCCPGREVISFVCCPYGRFATCCPDGLTCCPPGYRCTADRCVHFTDSSVLRVKAILLVNSTAGMDLKVTKLIPSQQVETASKRNGFIGTSGNVFSPDEKYHCPDGTSICELSSGIYGCCHLVRGYVKFWQENWCFLVVCFFCCCCLLDYSLINIFLSEICLAYLNIHLLCGLSTFCHRQPNLIN